MTIPTYPARPVNGGRLDKARPKLRPHQYEPKFNEWRCLIHTPTGAMWNRHGERLSIEKDFAKVLPRLKSLAHAFEWLDCGARQRRALGMGAGSLIVFDFAPSAGPDRALTFIERRNALHEALGPIADDPWELGQTPERDEILFIPPQTMDAADLWFALQEENDRLGTDVYEGLVAKADKSTYPMQLQSAAKVTPWWVKHRWDY